MKLFREKKLCTFLDCIELFLRHLLRDVFTYLFSFEKNTALMVAKKYLCPLALLDISPKSEFIQTVQEQKHPVMMCMSREFVRCKGVIFWNEQSRCFYCSGQMVHKWCTHEFSCVLCFLREGSLHACTKVPFLPCKRRNTLISKNVVGEKGEWQLSNGDCTTEWNYGSHIWYAKLPLVKI